MRISLFAIILLSFAVFPADKIPENMVFIKGGTFMMGDSVKKETKVAPFWIDPYEVTNADYGKCVAAKVCAPVHYTDSLGHGYDGKEWPQEIIPQAFRAPEVPVTCVDWVEAKKYCEWLGKRLPTEAEWEFAARAGTSTKYYWGDAMDTACVWYLDNAGSAGHKPGLKKPNAFGLYDMSGNVWEWCDEWFDLSKTKRVFKGGSWVSKADAVFSFSRKGAPPESRYCNNGFRCVK
jgi:formylglycine-generating enzyme required for sulfatase activity